MDGALLLWLPLGDAHLISSIPHRRALLPCGLVSFDLRSARTCEAPLQVATLKCGQIL